MFENRVLRRVFVSKGDEVIREWRKVHNEELKDFREVGVVVIGWSWLTIGIG